MSNRNNYMSNTPDGFTVSDVTQAPSDVYSGPNMNRAKYVPSDIPGTIPDGMRYQSTQRDEDYQRETEIVGGVTIGETKVLPVVGWLVGINGDCCFGKDYKLHEGYNLVGRGKGNDIMIDNPHINRSGVCQVFYDPKGGKFSLITSKRMAIYHNGEVLDEGSRPLKAYDRVQLGYDNGDYIAELMFVPLCGEHFKWEDQNKRVDQK